jgi:hypothetical protein
MFQAPVASRVGAFDFGMWVLETVKRPPFKVDGPSRNPRYFLSEFQGKFMYWSRVS